MKKFITKSLLIAIFAIIPAMQATANEAPDMCAIHQTSFDAVKVGLGYCAQDSDCIVYTKSCEAGCGHLINSAQESSMDIYASNFETNNCGLCESESCQVEAPTSLKCVEYKCVAN